jgi:hypothetical protein
VSATESTAATRLYVTSKHQQRYTRAEGKLNVVRCVFRHRRFNVVVEPAPVIPSQEKDRLVPSSGLNDGSGPAAASTANCVGGTMFEEPWSCVCVQLQWITAGVGPPRDAVVLGKAKN